MAEESGWKLVHGDVFRPPPRAGLLAVYLGTGVQVLSRNFSDEHAEASNMGYRRQ